MIKAIASKLRIDNNEDKLAKEFLSYTKDILNNSEFKKLNNYTQHCGTNRLQHCLNVSYYSFIWAKHFNLNARSAARAGLLHDFYLYDRHKDKIKENHIFYHPKVAYENAKKITNLNKIEKDAILNHMFPLCKSLPKYKESYVVTFSDKYCTILEVSYQLYKKFVPKRIIEYFNH